MLVYVGRYTTPTAQVGSAWFFIGPRTAQNPIFRAVDGQRGLVHNVRRQTTRLSDARQGTRTNFRSFLFLLW